MILVDREAYLSAVCRYVVLNPVRAGMVRHPREWPWSSNRDPSWRERVDEGVRGLPRDARSALLDAVE